MPILPENRKRYPRDWKAIALRIKERAGWKSACERAGVSGFQFRDLRAKAGTDKTESSGDIRQAQKQLGHSNITTTEGYVRKRRGDKVTPTR